MSDDERLSSRGWITVAEAVSVAGRSRRAIYYWAEHGDVRSTRGPDGVLRVWGQDVLTAEATMQRGRPRGSARPPS